MTFIQEPGRCTCTTWEDMQQSKGIGQFGLHFVACIGTRYSRAFTVQSISVSTHVISQTQLFLALLLICTPLAEECGSSARGWATDGPSSLTQSAGTTFFNGYLENQ